MSTTGLRVLLVEDDPRLLAEAVTLLVADGMDVIPATNGDEALASIENTCPPSILVTDIKLGGAREGLHLARAVAERWPNVRLLIMSGECRPNHAEYPERALFVTKPFPGQALLTLLRSDDW